MFKNGTHMHKNIVIPLKQAIGTVMLKNNKFTAKILQRLQMSQELFQRLPNGGH